MEEYASPELLAGDLGQDAEPAQITLAEIG
jgi:hypothetical protein